MTPPIPPLDQEPPLSAHEVRLHAYVDGQLSPSETIEVEAWLRNHPDDAARVAAWQQLNQVLAQHFAIPEAVNLPRAHARKQSVWPIAASWAAVAACVGGLAGWAGHGAWTGVGVGGTGIYAQRTPANVPLETARIALAAHSVYAVEKRHPVEVGANEQAHLLAWLSKRLGQPLQAPSFQAEGYQLLGGRLLASEDGPAAHLLYENADGQRLTLVIKAAPATLGAQEAGFRVVEQAGLSAFYWYEAKLAYALSGPLPRSHLLRIAQDAYQQLAP